MPSSITIANPLIQLTSFRFLLSCVESDNDHFTLLTFFCIRFVLAMELTPSILDAKPGPSRELGGDDGPVVAKALMCAPENKVLFRDPWFPHNGWGELGNPSFSALLSSPPAHKRCNALP
jgi:hypothetical protein